MGVLVALAAIAVFLGMNLLAKGHYEELMSHIDRKEYPLKDLLPLGIWVSERVGLRFNGRYDRIVNARMLELYGSKWSRFYVRVHWANRIAGLLTGLLFGILYAVGSETLLDGMIGILVITILLTLLPDVDLKRRVQKKRASMQADFPEFLNKLTLLVDAGLPVSGAWMKLVEESRHLNHRPLYKELELAYCQIRAGKGEVFAYEDFAKRCRMMEVTKFVAVLLMNIRKGSGELVTSLKALSDDCWEARVHTARRAGEEASTKLLFPMMLMLAGVMVIIIIPVLLEFQNI